MIPIWERRAGSQRAFIVASDALMEAIFRGDADLSKEIEAYAQALEIIKGKPGSWTGDTRQIATQVAAAWKRQITERDEWNARRKEEGLSEA